MSCQASAANLMPTDIENWPVWYVFTAVLSIFLVLISLQLEIC